MECLFGLGNGGPDGDKRWGKEEKKRGKKRILIGEECKRFMGKRTGM